MQPQVRIDETEQTWQFGCFEDGLRNRISAPFLLDKGLTQQIIKQPDGNQVQHNGGNHLMRAGCRPQKAGNRSVKAANQQTGNQHQRQMQGHRQAGK